MECLRYEFRYLLWLDQSLAQKLVQQRVEKQQPYLRVRNFVLPQLVPPLDDRAISYSRRQFRCVGVWSHPALPIHEFASGLRHTLVHEPVDYINHPREDTGYRGIHLIYRYRSDRKKRAWNGRKIEVQLRTKLQHAWATAVETIGAFKNMALKSNPPVQ